MLQNHILYQDEFLFVLDKPSGWVVNRSNTWHKETVQDLVEEHIDFSDVDEQSDFYNRTGIVHRLDKETSGALIVAKTLETFLDLQKQFKNRTVQKEYLALVFGSFSEEKVQVNAPIKRNPRNRMKFAVVSQGRPALTDFRLNKVISVDDEPLSLVTAMPKTGRTHQIRVHLAALNHPVVGDHLYLGKKRFLKIRAHFNRLMLHAYKITFTHPITKKEVKVTAHLPDIFKDLV